VTHPSRVLLLLVSTLLVAVRGPLVAQDAAPPPDPEDQAADSTEVPRFRVEANFVRVDAYVTKDGVAVRDLKAEDFEILEDGKPQTIESFEHVDVRTRAPLEQRREPQSVAEGRAMAEDPRARVFVVFLDTHHTDVIGSYRIQRPLVKLLEGMIGEDDVFAVMTPEMSVRDLSFARRTTAIEGMLRRHWAWGQEGQLATPDPVEQAYETCYWKPGEEWIALEMKAKRRERRTLSALSDLAVALRDLREERKAVIAITSGWRLFRPDPRLADGGLDEGEAPPLPRPGVGPGGRLEANPDKTGFGSTLDCETDRIHLAHLDNHDYFLDILDRANRGNVSFYPVDAQGLRSWGTGWGPGQHADHGRAEINARINTLRLLSEGTDGFAIVNTNDFDRGMRRIVDDLTSYYLLGYYSSSEKLDGKFRSIKVRVKRPGVQVRARRGYQAPTEEEVETARRGPVSSAANMPPRAVQVALGSLAGASREQPLATHVSWIVPGGAAGAAPDGRLWVTAEIDDEAVRSGEWTGGGTAELMVIRAEGDDIVGTARARIQPKSRIASMQVRDVMLPPGEYIGRLRVRPSGGSPVTEMVVFTVPGEGESAVGQPLLRRAGPGAGAAFTPTARPVLRRNERLRVEVPVAIAVDTARIELLDRNGTAMPVPVEASVQPDDGFSWVVGEVALAPLTAGDYVVRVTIESAGRRHEMLRAFRVGR